LKIGKSIAVLKEIIFLKRLQWQSPEQIKKIQEKRLEIILAHAAKTKYYRDTSALDDFFSIPITEKDPLRQDPDSFISAGYGRDSLRAVETSGSTGKPLELYLDEASDIHRQALLFYVANEFGRTPFDRFAAIKSYGPKLASATRSSFWLYPTITLYSSSKEKDNLRLMQDFRANILSGFPSMIGLMAKLNEGLRLKSVFSGGELLHRNNRRMIEDSFSCPVFNSYASWEAGSIAWECPEEHKLHVNSSSCCVEIVNQKGRPKSDGMGQVLITPLHNRAMPLIRYRLGDLGSWGNECPCGRGLPVLKAIQGRNDDLIVLPSGTIRSPISMNVSHLDCVVRKIWEYQIVQESPDLIIFRYVPLQPLTQPDIKIIENKIRELCLGEKVAIEFDSLESLKRGKSGKLRRIISKVRP
jgi:phenylacetate-CoA ligase